MLWLTLLCCCLTLPPAGVASPGKTVPGMKGETALERGGGVGVADPYGALTQP